MLALATPITFIWLPNFFTIIRLVLVPPIFVAALNEMWVVGLWLVLAALATDFFDGWAAKRFHAQTKLGEYLDPLADFTLAATGVGIMVIAGDVSLWLALGMLALAAGVGYVKFMLPSHSRLHKMQPTLSVPCLFAVWLATVWYFAAHAYGWSWWYVLLSFVLLLAMAYPKRHRLQAWFGWVSGRR